MKAKYIGPTEGISLTNGKTYLVLAVEYGFLRVVDDTEEDYLYSPENFELLEDAGNDK